MASTTSTSQSDAGREDSHTAIRNAVKLTLSLVFTWGIALAVRLLLPRHLGPERFGILNFADAFTVTAFVFLSLGLETYVRKEVSVRAELASGFFAGVYATRMALTALVLVGITILLRVTGRPPEVQRLVYLYAAAQFFVNSNNLLGALLHARGTVDGLSILNVATKIVWGGGVALGIAFDAGLWAYGLSYLASEAVETVVLYQLCRKHLSLKLRFDLPLVWSVLAGSLPFYLANIAHNAYNRLDVSFLSFMAGNSEAGYYGAASNLGGLTMLIAPLIFWVMLPLMARAKERSTAELDELICRATEAILATAVPMSLVISLGADLWIRIVYGAAFAPSILALQILAPMFIVTYVAIVSSVTLSITDRAWTLTRISLCGLAFNPLLNVVLIPLATRVLHRPGGAGAGSAFAMLLSEAFVMVLGLVAVGPRAFDRRNRIMIGKTFLCSLATLAVHVAGARLGPVRLALDAVTYAVLVLLSGALNVREIIAFARAVRATRAKAGEAAPAVAAAAGAAADGNPGIS